MCHQLMHYGVRTRVWLQAIQREVHAVYSVGLGVHCITHADILCQALPLLATRAMQHYRTRTKGSLIN
jgi:hypothetical protein